MGYGTLPLFAVIARGLQAGCEYNTLEWPPCSDTGLCVELLTDPCSNISPDRWTTLGLENKSVTAIA